MAATKQERPNGPSSFTHTTPLFALSCVVLLYILCRSTRVNRTLTTFQALLTPHLNMYLTLKLRSAALLMQ
jgi:hypothetical protein